ncbi:MAG: cytochrome b/b6 domain-containing protein [Planktotalea sp.]|uniref:cytochrome b/b6 domain-containing protein n=1 Tax=Planktotalea sp. TaxID=2029877 RepID=UPI003C73D0B8
MPASNTARSYGSLAKTFHWLTVLLILTAIPLGIISNRLPFETGDQLAFKALMFSLHKTVGVTAFFVALARILWAISQTKPAGLHPERRAETLLAELVHWLLYGSLVLVPLTGWIHHAATTGFAPIWWPFGQNLFFVPKSETLAATTAGLHIVFERVLMISIILHIAGALKHHFIDKDDTLRRMLPGKTEAGTPHPANKTLPIVLALVAWIAAMGVGSLLGLYHAHSDAADRAVLEEVNSDWTVETGTLTLSITQFGSEVTGSFEDWTADITYAAKESPGSHGTVRALISIGSLTLGSVTGQALGPDFFDASTHPTAQFNAELVYQADGYIAEGALTIRGITVPVRMPFNLTVEGETADMKGRLLLDRRAFNIGDNMPDEGSLAFAVNVNVALRATRTAN